MATLQLTTGQIKIKESREEIIETIEANIMEQSSLIHGSFTDDYISVNKQIGRSRDIVYKEISLNPQYIVYIE